MSYLYFWILTPYQICFANVFSDNLPFQFVDDFVMQKLFQFSVVSFLFTFVFVPVAFGVKSKNSLPRPMSRSFFLMFSSSGFMVSGLIFKFK